MSEATIIKLAPNATVKVASFEDAFGEYSEARGRGRSRREAKRMEKQKRRMAKIARKDERRRARKTGRVSRKAEKRRLKQEAKTARVEEKLKRKMLRKEGKEQRKMMGDEPEMEMDEQTSVETGNGYSEDTGGYSEDTGGYSEDDQSSDQGYSEDAGNGSSGESVSTDEGSYSEEDQTEETDESPVSDETEDMGYSEDEEFSDEESSFSGEAGDGKITVHPKVKEVAMKVEWNKELVSRLNSRKKELQKMIEINPDKKDQIEATIAHIDESISRRKNRISQLDNALSSFSSADGGAEHPERSAMVKKARRIAKAKRMGLKKRKKGKPVTHGGSETPVESDLNPEFSEQKIVVPSSGNFDGDPNGNATGIIALDDENDFDAPETRIVEVKSSADGSKGIDLKKVAIGIGLAALAIYLAKKAKVI